MYTRTIILFFLCLIPSAVMPQTYKYIGIADGASNRRIIDIQKDAQGYMWFLTDEGIDKYDGENFNHYELDDAHHHTSDRTYPGWIYVGSDKNLWLIGKKGDVFQYDKIYDRFRWVYSLPAKRQEEINYGYMDSADNIWLCSNDSIVLYDTGRAQAHRLPNILHRTITCIEQVDESRFFIATETGVHYFQLKDRNLTAIPVKTIDYFHALVTKLYYQKELGRLFIGTFERGVFVYDMASMEIIRPEVDLSDVNITCFKELDADRLLIATEGMGIYEINPQSCEVKPYLVTDYESYNDLSGNSINNIYIDEEKRIWLATYPVGVTIVDRRYQNYRWIKHSAGNPQSLINDQVNSVIEDSDGDLWFATNNGVSLYQPKVGQWHSFLSSYDYHLTDKNNIFVTLCEVSPGVIWVGGYTSGIYKIRKSTLSVDYFSPFLLSSASIRPDKYIRDIVKDSSGLIWTGGYYNLKCITGESNVVSVYSGITSITAIAEKDPAYMWIGTTSGLYLLDKETSDCRLIEMPVETRYINALYQSDNGLLYIGTHGSGMLVYDIENDTFEHYYSDNSLLVSNSIFTILPESNGRIMMSTDDGISCFSTQEKTFTNWTKEQGLLSAYFTATSGVLRKDGSFIFGSTDGALEFPADVVFPRYTYSPMIFSDFHISYQPVYPNEKNSPLKKDINETSSLKLSHDQNTFSFKVSSINYDYASNVLYTWKLERFDDEWSPPETTNLVRFTNLPPGKYTFRIRAVSRELQKNIFEERTIRIVIARPFWATWWAITIYVLLAVFIMAIIIHVFNLRRQKKISDEKTRFFINTAHDIRTPLTLIKAPLEDMLEKESLPADAVDRTHTALRNVDVLLRLTTNLIKFERADVYSSTLYIAEYELNAYLKEVYDSFVPYAESKHIDFTYKSNFNYLNVWMDKEKMDSVLKNILSNALKYTPDGGKVCFSAYDDNDSWKIEVEDTGIGIPAAEQNKLFRLHFRAGNAINSKIAGTGIGLVLVGKLVRLHGGKIDVESVEHQGTTIQITFPKEKKRFHTFQQVMPEKEIKRTENLVAPTTVAPSNDAGKADLPRILIVEDNDELRSYLVGSLSAMYHIQACSNGKEALTIVKTYCPELILSDIMMPEMRGDELCVAIKNDIETSHIPMLLLTALGDENHIMNGLQIGADGYLTKPFSIGILRANIANLLANRALLRSKYASLDLSHAEVSSELSLPSLPDEANNLDRKFMSTVEKNIEENLSNPDFTVDTLCELHNMSRTSFYNKLKALTGQSPSDFIRIIRLNRAARLLKEGKHSVTEVAEMTGFSDSKYFREVFKKYYNMNPTRYAKGGNE